MWAVVVAHVGMCGAGLQLSDELAVVMRTVIGMFTPLVVCSTAPLPCQARTSLDQHNSPRDD